MAGRRRKEHLGVSLLPFLSVLACVIGTLTLLLAAVAVGRMGGTSLEEIRLSERFDAIQAALAAGRAKLEMLEAQSRKHAERARAEQEIGRRLAGLGLELDVSLEELEALVDLLERERALDAEGRRLAERERRLAGSAEQKTSEVAARDALQQRAPIVIDPSGLGRTQRPYLIECGADSIELHRTKGDWSYRIPAEEIPESKDLQRFLRRVQVIQDAILIFLIRPDGVLTYDRAATVATQHRVRHAKLPLPGDGPLDLSRFSER